MTDRAVLQGQTPLHQLARLVTSARHQKQDGRGKPLSKPKAAQAIGISRQTLDNVETGRKRASDVTYVQLEHFFGWAPGSIRTYLDESGPKPAAARSRSTVRTRRAGSPIIAPVPPMKDSTEVTANGHDGSDQRDDLGLTRAASMVDEAPDTRVRHQRMNRIGNLVHDERVSRGMSVNAACEAARRARPQDAVGPGISKSTWEKVEKGRSVRPSAWAGVERLFNWPSGGIRRYVEGDGPQPGRPPEVVVEQRPVDAGMTFIERVGPISHWEASVLESVLNGLRKPSSWDVGRLRHH